jgi:nicotinamidase/pyrazinamidase
VQGSPGAAFHPGLRLPAGTVVLSKGADPEQDSYSAFEAFTEEGIGLEQFLAEKGVRQLYVGGLATEYCVRSSALDALQAGLSVTVLRDAIAGVDVNPGDSARAIEEMKQAGVRFGTVDDLLPISNQR